MSLSIMLSVLVIQTEYAYSIVKINQIQAIELVENIEGGVLTITLNGDKSEQVVYAEENKDKWVKAKKWLEKETINLSSQMTTSDRQYVTNRNPEF